MPSSLVRHPRIVLSELRSLDLVDYHNPIRQFLHLTQLPAVTLVNLDFMDFVREAPVLGHIFTEIQSAWNKGEPATSPMRRPVERMDVWEFDETHNSASTIALYFREPTSPLGPNSEAQLRFSLCRDKLQVEDIIAEVKGYTDISSSLTALEVYNFTAFPKESWRSSFGDCSALRKIGFIRSNGIRHFITALNNDLAWADSYPDAHADDSKPSPPMLMLPSLNVIELVWITDFNLDLDGPADVLIGLGGMLKNRLNLPHPILELHFDECNAVEQKRLLRLRDQVGPDLRVFQDGNAI
ncbi:hypothetical protein NMY22_g16422 [Coprinellus aureogranulatus]|nr:hypothetical protein NMY22_g16422 [Coprinellus aureogranulatus]